MGETTEKVLEAKACNSLNGSTSYQCSLCPWQKQGHISAPIPDWKMRRAEKVEKRIEVPARKNTHPATRVCLVYKTHKTPQNAELATTDKT